MRVGGGGYGRTCATRDYERYDTKQKREKGNRNGNQLYSTSAQPLVVVPAPNLWFSGDSDFRRHLVAVWP
jgi:hypothetical protein